MTVSAFFLAAAVVVFALGSKWWGSPPWPYWGISLGLFFWSLSQLLAILIK